MPFKHAEKEHAAKLYCQLAEARNIVAGMRSSMFFNAFNVDAVTLQIVSMQDELERVLRDGKFPEVPPLTTAKF